MKLANKVALITGAGSGMGRAAAILFAKEGARVAAVDVNRESAQNTASEITSAGGKAIGIRADVSKTEDVRAMVDETIRAFGVPNVLYNNAGIEGESNFMAEMSEEGFDRVISINLRGVWLGMKYTLPHMVKNGGGTIINTASVAGLVGLKGSSGYSAAKAGVIALTRVAAIEYGRYNIRVNAICPGVIETPMVERINQGARSTPPSRSGSGALPRNGQPEEIAHMALFLASDDCAFATGAPFIIDGGWSAR